MLTKEKPPKVRMSACADYIADAIGLKFDKMTAIIWDKPKVAGPLGLTVDTRMKFSHGTQQESYLAVCWKVVGSLYIIVAFEPDTFTTTVALLDKKRYVAKHPDRVNLAEVAKAADQKELIDELEGYLTLWKEALVGVWSRTGSSEGWTKLDL